MGDVRTLTDPDAAKVLHIPRKAVHMVAAGEQDHPAHTEVGYMVVRIHKVQEVQVAGCNRDLEAAHHIQAGCNQVPGCIRHTDQMEEEVRLVWRFLSRPWYRMRSQWRQASISRTAGVSRCNVGQLFIGNLPRVLASDTPAG